VVVVDQAQERNKDVYRSAIGVLCAKKPGFCKVLFWSDERAAPRSMPMTDSQVAAMRADWTYNGKTGTRSLVWHCSIDPDPQQCFR